MNRSEQINELAAALAKAQGSILGAAKDTENPFFKRKYADLASVWEACRAPLSSNGLAVTQIPELLPEAIVRVTTTLLHASGQFISAELQAPVDGKLTPQSIGSAITYLRRYSLASVVGVAPEDDDGNAASGKTEAQNGHSKTDAKATAEKSVKLTAELRKTLEGTAGSERDFESACAKIKEATDKEWITARQRDELHAVALEVFKTLPVAQPAQASK